MKVRLLLTFAFLITWQVVASAQEKNVQNSSRCKGFTTPVIKPQKTKIYSPLIKPNPRIDYKLKIVNPCTETEKAILPIYKDFKSIIPPKAKTTKPANESVNIIGTKP